MAKPHPFPENSLEDLKAALKRARTKEQFQRVLCLWLRAALGLNAQQVATALGWSVQAVYNHQWRYLKRGQAALDTPGRGGRRHGVLPRDEENALLTRLRIMALPDDTVDFATIRQAVEQAVGRPVNSWTVRRMLERHHWEVHALAVSPRKHITRQAADRWRREVTADSYEIKEAPNRNAVRYVPPQDSPPRPSRPKKAN
jgi:transposase